MLIEMRVKAERVDDFKALSGAHHRASIAESGCLRFDVAQSRDDPTRFVVWEWFIDRAAAEEHWASPHYASTMRQAAEMLADDIVSTWYDGRYPERA